MDQKINVIECCVLLLHFYVDFYSCVISPAKDLETELQFLQRKLILVF